jgi:hypothetical protein
MKNTLTKNKDKEKQRLKKYKEVQKQVIASLTKAERKALGL